MREIPIRKIVGSPWKEGEIRLEVDKVIYVICLTLPLNQKKLHHTFANFKA